MRKLLLGTAGLAMLGFAGTASAGSDSGSFDITAEVEKTCEFTYPAGGVLDLEGGQQAVGDLTNECNFDGLETPVNSGLQITFSSQNGGMLNDDNTTDVNVPYTFCITDIPESDAPSGVYCASSASLAGGLTYAPDAWKTVANVVNTRPVTIEPQAGVGNVAGTYEDTITIDITY